MIRYAPNFNKIYKFAEYGDYDNYFVELCYVCPRGEFASRIGAPLANQTAIDGKPIFRAENIELAKYKLLNEQVEPLEYGAVDYLKVVETYGYAPSRNYTTYTAEPVRQFGLEDPSGYKRFTVDTRQPTTYNVSEDTFNLCLQSVEGLKIGDLIRMRFEPQAGTNSYLGDGPDVPVKSIISGDLLSVAVITAFESTFYNPSGDNTTFSKQATANIISNINAGGWQGNRYFIRPATARAPKTVIKNVVNEISFYDTFPQLEGRFIISSGTTEVETITENTTPSVAEWKDLVAAQSLINIQDATVDIVYPQTFFKKTVKKVVAT